MSPTPISHARTMQRMRDKLQKPEPLVPAACSEIRFSRDEAAGLAIRVEDAMNIMNSLLDGAEQTTHPDDWKRKTTIIMARDRNRHLAYVARLLRGESQN